MTIRKSAIPLGTRLTAYVTREQGAAELQVSPSTWDEMVECGQIPKPRRLGRMGAILRWRWEDVDRALSGDNHSREGQPEPFFHERAHGPEKNHQREAA